MKTKENKKFVFLPEEVTLFPKLSGCEAPPHPSIYRFVCVPSIFVGSSFSWSVTYAAWTASASLFDLVSL